MASKEGGRPRLRNVYRKLSKLMKAYRWTSRNGEELFEEVADPNFFALLDISSEYWKIRIYKAPRIALFSLLGNGIMSLISCLSY